MSIYEAATSITIEFDMDNSIFGLPREFVVASAGKHVYAYSNLLSPADDKSLKEKESNTLNGFICIC